MSPIICNPFKKYNKIVPCTSVINCIPKLKKQNETISIEQRSSKPIRNDHKNSFNQNKTYSEIKLNNNDNDNSIIESIYIQLSDNEKRLKRLQFYIDRLEKDSNNSMDMLYHIEKKIDLYDLKFNRILHIRY